MTPDDDMAGNETKQPVESKHEQDNLTLNRPGFCRLVWPGGRGQILPPCNFCLNAQIDLKLGK